MRHALKVPTMTTWIRWLDDIGMADVPVVGGKNASLGEMRRGLAPLGIRTPDGFATTAEAYREFLHAASLERVIAEALGAAILAPPSGPAGAGR